MKEQFYHNDMRLLIEKFGDRNVCIGGVGKMFYQDGFPVSITILQLNKSNIEVSLLHVADECLKNGWTPTTVIKKIREDFADSGYTFDMKDIELFCNSDYETQRKMIFEYLFNNVEPKQWLREKISTTPE